MRPSSQSPDAHQNLSGSSYEQRKRKKCSNSLGWRSDVYPRSLREAKCETAEALAGPLKQQRIDSSQVPVAKLGYCLCICLWRGCCGHGDTPAFLRARLCGTGVLVSPSLPWKDALLLWLPCKMDHENHGDMSEDYRLCWGKSCGLFQHQYLCYLLLPTSAHRCTW